MPDIRIYYLALYIIAKKKLALLKSPKLPYIHTGTGFAVELLVTKDTL